MTKPTIETFPGYERHSIPCRDQDFKPVDVEAAKKITGRECGDCSLCCRLLDVPETNKQPSQWCLHCRPGKGGCSIYADRPQACRQWACGWLTNRGFGDEWFPKKCGIISDLHLSEHNTLVMRFLVDPRTPDVWRKEPFYSAIKQIALNGLQESAGQQFTTVVSTGANRPRLVVLPHKETEYGPGGVLRVGPDQWEFIKFESNEAALAFDSKVRAVLKIVFETRDTNPDMAPMEVLEHAAPKLRKLFDKAGESTGSGMTEEEHNELQGRRVTNVGAGATVSAALNKRAARIDRAAFAGGERVALMHHNNDTS
jgi:hypothetical protein